MQPYSHCNTLVEVGVDWITARATEPESGDALRRHGYDLTYDAIHAGYPPSAWTFYGYSGVTAGDVSWGVCERGVIVQVRGAEAELRWAPLARLADRINRLDVMATVAVTPPFRDVTGELIAAYQASPTMNHRKARASWIRDSDGGSTFYSGRRGSEMFYRIYNKEKESPRIHAYAGCWRYEAQLSGKTATTVAASLLNAKQPRRMMVDYLRTYLLDRSLPCYLPPGDECRIPVSHISESTDEKALDWLTHTVGPTVRRLLHNGRRAAVLDALGLADD